MKHAKRIAFYTRISQRTQAPASRQVSASQRLTLTT
jgi:hypothetical protein